MLQNRIVRAVLSGVIAICGSAALIAGGHLMPVVALAVLGPGAMIATVALIVLDALQIRANNLPFSDDFDGPVLFVLASIGFGVAFWWIVSFVVLTRRARRVRSAEGSDALSPIRSDRASSSP